MLTKAVRNPLALYQNVLQVQRKARRNILAGNSELGRGNDDR